MPIVICRCCRSVCGEGDEVVPVDRGQDTTRMEAMKKSVSIVVRCLIPAWAGLVGSAAAQDLDDYNGPMSTCGLWW